MPSIVIFSLLVKFEMNKNDAKTEQYNNYLTTYMNALNLINMQ